MNKNIAATPEPEALLAQRRAGLADLRLRADSMLAELAQVTQTEPPGRIATEPEQALASITHFCRHADFTAASEDGLTWMLNRLGLFVARIFIGRHGGQLHLQEDPLRSFHLHYVVTGMAPPVPADANLDPFAIAHEVVHALPKPDLADLIAKADSALLNGA